MRSTFVLAAGAALALSLGLPAALARAPLSAPLLLADAAPQPVGEALPQLPTVEVPPRPAHTVPNYDPPPAPVTFDHSAPPPVPVQRPTEVISGAARLGDALSLTIGGRHLPLYGVRLPAKSDRCSVRKGDSARACSAQTRKALAARLAGTIHCRLPPRQRGHRAAAICLDSRGVDLGGFLVGEGLALADRTVSDDYVGAEGVARSLRRGLWRYR
jgi:endonuclease YncB( thermonuclease family)